MAFEYQSFATLNVNLNRQSYGPLDISVVFNTQADLNYYLTKGASTTGVSDYWKAIVPYPYAGQVIATVFDGVKVFALSEKADGTFETVSVGDTTAVEAAIEALQTELNSIKSSVEAIEDKNTTYTFASGTDGKFTVTPSDGEAQEISVGITLPSKVSDLENDSKFQNDTEVAAAIAASLADYYNKTSVDGIKTELEGKISAIPKFAIEVATAAEDGTPNVTEPSNTTVYLVPDNDPASADVYDEWIHIEIDGVGSWELLGKQTLDLSGYALTSYVDSEVKKVADNLATLSGNHDALAIVVGDAESGLVKDVADLKSVDIAALIATSKQEAIDAAAAAVPVKTVNELEFTLTDGALAINEIAQDKVAGLPDALSNRYTKTESDAAIQAAVSGIYENVYTKQETLDKISEKITEINANVGESAASVLSQLNDYKTLNDARVDEIEKDIEDINTNVDQLATASINVNRLTQDTDSYLILDGGDSTSFI